MVLLVSLLCLLTHRGESYAGIYVPTLVSAITAHNAAIGKGASGTRINLKGFAVSADEIQVLVILLTHVTHRSAMDVLGRTLEDAPAKKVSKFTWTSITTMDSLVMYVMCVSCVYITEIIHYRNFTMR